jgi:hypothetical protein
MSLFLWVGPTSRLKRLTLLGLHFFLAKINTHCSRWRQFRVGKTKVEDAEDNTLPLTCQGQEAWTLEQRQMSDR